MFASNDTYEVRSTAAPEAKLLAADGRVWRPAKLVTWGPEVYATHFRALWSTRGLLVRYDAVDPAPWHTMTERDDQLWEEEVVEIFIDPDNDGRNYAEIEINPINVVCDLVIYDGAPDLRSDITWSFTGLRTEVTPMRNESGDVVGWTAVASLPWEGFESLPESGSVRFPPAPGDAWRFNVFRIKRPGGPSNPEQGVVYAAWSPVSGRSFHEPAAFRRMEFED